jgi:hypothetical protein
MFKPHLTNKGVGPLFLFFLFMLLWPPVSGANPEFLPDLDLDNSDPVEFSSRIMEIDYGKGMLVVAENEVMVVDSVIGDEQFTSLVTDPEGEVISLESLHSGQKVLVRGLKLPDGRVLASMVRLLGAPGLTNKTVREFTPVEKIHPN